MPRTCILRSTILTSTLLLICVLSVPSVYADAWIYSFDGPHRAYQIKRNGELLPISVFQTIRANDEIKVLSQGFSLTLGFPTGVNTTITRENSPYVVADTGEIPSRIDNFLYWAQSTIRELGGEEDLIGVNMVTRSRQTQSPPVYVTNYQQRLQMGRVSINLFSENPTSLNEVVNDQLKVRKASANHVVTMQLGKTPLPVKISLAGNTLILSNDSVPHCPYEDKGLPSSNEICTLWLFKQQDGQWEIEALSRLMSFEDSSLRNYLIQLLWYAVRQN